MKRPIFVYGTLLDGNIRGHVLGRLSSHLGPRARLKNYCCVHVKHKAYPSIKKRAFSSTTGRIIYRLPAALVLALDDYEGSEYGRINVRINVRGQVLIATCYIAKQAAGISSIPWQINSRVWQRRRESYIRSQFSPSKL
ncbi:MAG: gamma-glutamylcyclotransferase family protein [Rhodospirillales bacterium]